MTVSEPTPLHDYLEYTLKQYPPSAPFGRDGRQPFSDRVDRLKEALARDLGVDEPLVVKASFGQGNWAQVPWLSIMDSRLTTSTRKEVYVVYLFRADMSGVYLTLAQGVTELIEAHKGVEARRIMRERATHIQRQLGDLPAHGFSFDPTVTLKSTTFGPDYEASVIAHTLYERDALPTEAQLVNDLKMLIEAYERYVEARMDEAQNAASPPAGEENLSLVEHLRAAFAARGLAYTQEQVGTFFTALQTKGFVIISGISGTGKSKIAQAFADILQPIPAPQPAPAEDLYRVTATALGAAHSITIPRKRWADFGLTAESPAAFVHVTFGDVSAECRTNWTNPGSQMEITLSGDVLEAFRAQFHEGDRYTLAPEQPGHWPPHILMTPERPPLPHQQRTLFLSVKPDWRDSTSLLGYYNPLTRSYTQPAFLHFVLQALHDFERRDAQANPWFVILDEMNLAHVEYYFAEILSILESGRGADGLTLEALRIEYPADLEGDVPRARVSLPPNLYFIGTVNLDETTHAFSPKVLDRAFSLEFSSVDFSHYPPAEAVGDLVGGRTNEGLLSAFTRGNRFARIEKELVASTVQVHPGLRQALQALNDLLAPQHMHFGYRVFDEIITFVALALQHGTLGSPESALDAAVMMKVLPKFNGGREKLWVPLVKVACWTVNPHDPESAMEEWRAATLGGRPESEATLTQVRSFLQDRPTSLTAARVLRMLGDLERDGFTAFG